MFQYEVLENHQLSKKIKCISLNKKKTCLARPALIDSSSGGLHYFPFMVSLDRCGRTCNTFDDLYNKMCVPSKRKDESLKVSNMIIQANESNN